MNQEVPACDIKILRNVDFFVFALQIVALVIDYVSAENLFFAIFFLNRLTVTKKKRYMFKFLIVREVYAEQLHLGCFLFHVQM